MTDKMIPVPRELLEEARDAFERMQAAEHCKTQESETRFKRFIGLAGVCNALLRAPVKEAVTPAVRDVLAERQRQISAEGWTPEHDDEHDKFELSTAAGCYALLGRFYLHQRPPFWPWDDSWWKPNTDPRRNLVKAGALILAEIERLDRAESPVPAARCPVCNGDDAEAPCAYTTERPDGCWRAARLNAAAHTYNEGETLPLSCPMAGQSNCALFGSRSDPLAQWTRDFIARQEPLGVNLGDLSPYYEGEPLPQRPGCRDMADRAAELEADPQKAAALQRARDRMSKPDDLEAMRRDADQSFETAARVMNGPRQQSDTELLDYLREECNDLRCIAEPTGGGDHDVRWLVISHHMAKPHERVVGRSFSEEPRDAIRAAMAAEKREG